MLRVGLTGSIGVGKSFVTSIFEELGCHVLDADLTAREVVMPGTPGLKAITEEFGEEILNTDGSLDATFGNGGKVVNPGQIHLPALIVQPDGKIVTAGATRISGITTDFAVVRYNANGTLDQTFGSGGYAVNGDGEAQALLLQPDGKIVLVGFITLFRNGSDFVLARFNSDGSVDPTFGSGGRVQTSFTSGRNSDDQAYAAALQPDGKMVAAGSISLLLTAR